VPIVRRSIHRRDRTRPDARVGHADPAAASAGARLERLDAEGLTGVVRVLRSVSGADNVATQGTVWPVDGKAL